GEALCRLEGHFCGGAGVHRIDGAVVERDAAADHLAGRIAAVRGTGDDDMRARREMLPLQARGLDRSDAGELDLPQLRASVLAGRLEDQVGVRVLPLEP